MIARYPLLGFLITIAAFGNIVSPCHGQPVEQPGLPARIRDASIDSSVVTREVTLHFALANYAEHPLREIMVAVLVKDGHGKPRAFQKSLERVNVGPGTEQALALRLSNLLYVDPTEGPIGFALGIEQARTEGASWKTVLSPAEFASALGRGEPILVAKGVSIEPFQGGCDVGFCLECRQTATCLCGTGCVLSSKCTTGASCSCEVTCINGGGCPNPPKVCQ